MSLGMQWMALICRATFSDPYGLRIIPFGVLMHGKEIGFNWTNVVSLPRLELSTFSMPSALTHYHPGEQQQVKLWVFLLAILRRILISSSWRETNSRSPQGVYQLNEGQSQRKAGPMWSWMLERKVDPVMRVVGRGYLATPLLIQNAPSWRPRRWPLTRTGLTQHMRRSEICLKACMTLTPGNMSDGQAKLRELVHLPRNWPLARLTIPLGGLSKQIDRILEGYSFRSWLPTATRMHTMER